MSDCPFTLCTDSDQEQSPVPADINITAQGDRRTLETLYLKLRDLAKQNGLQVDYRLSLSKPADEANS
jgi:predicted ATP-dependent protease